MALFSIGHSNHPSQEFVRLLLAHEIKIVVDVRSRPYSRFNPQFNRETLVATLKAAGIQYEWRGHYLGGLHPVTERDFVNDMEQVIADATVRNLALMCSERDPHECHRQSKLGNWAVLARGVHVTHIVPDTSPKQVQAPQQPGLFE